MSKRGQVTVFIILGIVLITSVGLFLYLGSETTESDVSREEAESFFSTQIDPIKKLVQDCTISSAFVVLETMGQYGGYVFPVYDLNDPHLELIMPDENILTVNYAAYQETCPTCQEDCPADDITCQEACPANTPILPGCFVNDFPTLARMKLDFQAYLEEVALNPNIEPPSVFQQCIDNFNVFREDFDDIDYSDLDTTVFFEDKIVLKSPSILSKR